MVEPLKPDLRDELKAEHEGLQDADIDRMEELISRRFTLDPERDAAELRAVDSERARLIRERMPRFDEVYQRVRAREIQGRRPEPGGPEFRIERRGPERQSE